MEKRSAKKPVDPAEHLVDHTSAQNRGRADPTMGPGFDRVVSKLFDDPKFDVEKTFDEIEKWLDKTDLLAPGALRDAVLRGENYARLAFKLHVIAKVKLRGYEVELDSVMGKLRDDAYKELQKQKELGQRSKQITDGDIEGQVAIMNTDQYERHSKNKERSKRMVEYLEALTGLCRTRCYTLATLSNPGRQPTP